MCYCLLHNSCFFENAEIRLGRTADVKRKKLKGDSLNRKWVNKRVQFLSLEIILNLFGNLVRTQHLWHPWRVLFQELSIRKNHNPLHWNMYEITRKYDHQIGKCHLKPLRTVGYFGNISVCFSRRNKNIVLGARKNKVVARIPEKYNSHAGLK